MEYFLACIRIFKLFRILSNNTFSSQMRCDAFLPSSIIILKIIHFTNLCEQKVISSYFLMIKTPEFKQKVYLMPQFIVTISAAIILFFEISSKFRRICSIHPLKLSGCLSFLIIDTFSAVQISYSWLFSMAHNRYCMIMLRLRRVLATIKKRTLFISTQHHT